MIGPTKAAQAADAVPDPGACAAFRHGRAVGGGDRSGLPPGWSGGGDPGTGDAELEAAATAGCPLAGRSWSICRRFIAGYHGRTSHRSAGSGVGSDDDGN